MSDPTELLKVTDYSATSVRTMTNSAGQVGFAPHNLILASEDFSDSNWTKTDTTVTPNAATAPDGTITADKISHDNSTASVTQGISSVDGVSYTVGIFAKYIDHQWLRLFTDGGDVWFDIQNGVLGTDNTDGATITALSDGWYYVTAADAATGSTYLLGIELSSADGSSTETSGTSAYIWGAHLYENGLAGMFDVPENERALASLTKYLPNKAVVTGANLVSNGTNLTTTTGWTGSNATLSVNGGYLRITDAGSSAYAYQGITTEANASYRVVVDYLFPSANVATDYEISIRDSGHNGTEIVDQTSGFVEDTASQTVIHFTASSASTFVRLQPASNTADYADYQVTVTKVDRDPTAARFLPRRGNHEYIDGAWVKGLFAESEARTNLFIDGVNIHDRGKSNTLVTDDYASSPHGSSIRIIDNSATGTGQAYIVVNAVTVATSTEYTYWGLFKKDQLDWVALQTVRFATPANVFSYFDLNNGVVGTAGSGHTLHMADVGDGWYLCGITFTTDASDTSGNIRIYLSDGDGDTTVDLDGTSSILMADFDQFEAGSTPSSLIPTYGATRTRTAETFTQKTDKIIWPNTTYVDGTELVTNGGFDSDVSGWTKTDADVTLAQSSGLLQVSHTTASTTRGGYQDITVTANAPYRVTCTVGGDDPQVDLFDGATFAGGSNLKSSTSTIDVVVVPSGTTLRVRVATTDSVSVATFDNISVKEINPRALCVVMHGYMTYADDNSAATINFWRQYADASNNMQAVLETLTTETGEVNFISETNGTVDKAKSATTTYSPGINVPFKIASRHLDNAIQGAADGTATTENTTPPGLPDLSSTQIEWFYDFMGHITDVAAYVEDIEEGGLTALTAKGFPQ